MEYSELYRFDCALESLHGTLVGTDEAGRGPLAGPVVAAAVVLDIHNPIIGINDSKKLSEKRREELFPLICSHALDVKATIIYPETIDHLNILQASLMAMRLSLYKVQVPWKYILVDGNQYIPNISQDIQRPIVGGDNKSASIAAASIVAKIVRDRLMVYYSKKYPSYGFEQHKGYPTILHREKIASLGLSPIHRKSFCSHLISQTSLFE